MSAVVAVQALLLASSSKSSSTSSSSFTFIIFIVLIFAVGYFLLIRPQKQRARKQREQQSAIGVGDEIVTVGGIVGRVVAVDPERITIVTGADTVGFAAAGNEPARLVLVRNAIGRKIEPPVLADPDEDEGHHAEHDGMSYGLNGSDYDGHDDVSGYDGHDAGAGDANEQGAGEGHAESGGTSP